MQDVLDKYKHKTEASPSHPPKFFLLCVLSLCPASFFFFLFLLVFIIKLDIIFQFTSNPWLSIDNGNRCYKAYEKFCVGFVDW